jgi:hypothetical protein
VEISNTFSAVENLCEGLDINNAWGSIRDQIKTSTKESLGHHRLRHNKPWFDDECSKLTDQRKQRKADHGENCIVITS